MRMSAFLLASIIAIAAGPNLFADVISGTMTCDGSNHYLPGQKGTFTADWGTDSSGKNSAYPRFAFTQTGMNSQAIYNGAIACAFDTAKLSQPLFCSFDSMITTDPVSYPRASNLCGEKYGPSAFRSSANLQYDNATASGSFGCVWSFTGSISQTDIWIDLTNCR